MIIKSFKKFNEVNGTELVGPVGPAFGEPKIPNTINRFDTSIKQVKDFINPYSKNQLTNDIVTEDDYFEFYNLYLKNNGEQSKLSGNKSTDIEIIIDFLKTKGIL